MPQAAEVKGVEELLVRELTDEDQLKTSGPEADSTLQEASDAQAQGREFSMPREFQGPF